MTRVTVRLRGGLERDAAPASCRTLDLPAGATLLDAQDMLGIPRGEVGLFVVDGELAHEGFAPQDGATIDIFPMFGGG